MARLVGSTNLDPELIKFIHARALLFPKIPRETLATALKYEIEAEAEERVNWRVPSHENLIRMISEARNHAPNHLDEPWSLGSLTKDHIPPEALPIVVSVYKKRLAENDPLLIREALWIARLYNIVDPPDLVWDWAFLYALWEMVSEDLGEPFDSRRLDLEMIQNVYYARETQREIDIWGIAEKYGSDPVKLKELNLSIEETEEIAKSGRYRKEAQNEDSNTTKRTNLY